MSAPRIRLHIDRIVLHGVDPGDKRAFAAAVRDELSRLLGSPPPAGLSRSRAVGRIEADSVRLGDKTGEMGRQVARSVFRGVAS